ncbi:glycosyltransferase family 2 protein [Flavobacteriaceae bacterium]|nr:glycosyltransferase family 2 protein [Flavobacteriaceae bacterium]
MTEKPLISIITVVFNGEKHLQQTINSVINQTYKNIEYIIIDGKSTDNTIDIIKSNINHIDLWISEKDDGLYDAMNKGIKLAKGELIGIINSDDWYEKHAIEIIVKAFNANPEKSIFHSNRYDVLSDGKKKEYKFNPSKYKFKYYNMTFSHPSVFITKKEYEKHLYNTSLQALSDYQFLLEAYITNSNSFYHVNKALVNFRLGGISSQTSFLKNIKEAYEMRRNVGMNFWQRIFAATIKILMRPLVIIKKKLQ